LAEGALEYPTGEVCAIGAVGKMRGIDMSGIDPYDSEFVGKTFGISSVMAREIVFENDEHDNWNYRAISETDEQRWQRMRDWAAGLLRSN
jgi:hypothetical protein